VNCLSSAKQNQINTFAKKVLFDAEKSAIDNRSKPSKKK
jgi:hypothetical protein